MRWIVPCAVCLVCACHAKESQALPRSEDTGKPAVVAAAVAAAGVACPQGAEGGVRTACVASGGSNRSWPLGGVSAGEALGAFPRRDHSRAALTDFAKVFF